MIIVHKDTETSPVGQLLCHSYVTAVMSSYARKCHDLQFWFLCFTKILNSSLPEYKTFVLKKRTTIQLFEKPVAMKAFEHLLALELVGPLHNVSQSSLPKEFRLMTLLVNHSQVSEILQTYPGCPTELQNWTSSMFA